MTEAWSSLLQTLAWVGVVVGSIVLFRTHCAALLHALVKRVERGDEVPTPWGPLRGAPEAIRKGEQVGVTEEGVGGVAAPDDVRKMLVEKRYSQGIVEDLYLVHESGVTVARTSQRPGLYRVRIWLEAYIPSELDSVERVSYRLYNDEFPEPVVATEARANSFELWLNVYGEFTVVAYAERRGKPSVWLTRYLDLPGRPPE
jgi:hypothetical protein